MYRISGMTGFPRFGLCMYEMPSFPLGVLSEACVLLGHFLKGETRKLGTEPKAVFAIEHNG